MLETANVYVTNDAITKGYWSTPDSMSKHLGELTEKDQEILRTGKLPPRSGVHSIKEITEDEAFLEKL